ncbi:MAG: addiction module toxin, HicA family [Desulfobacteraceae bacterium 4484_190.1]|nr:MAG: addiction module toxin, HicA family [Desulfobacteraceae bacterium 4484_190.1]
MKRRDLIHHLEHHGCEFFREGKKHTVYINPRTGKCSTVPRHKEVIDFTAKKICKDLEIPLP